ncbi:MAG: hypothetical protein KAI67_02195 [Candidatus Pacebacteria bacterium]|nr:hypothetical protein [Candidatus Paceibacterota bacterium]
MSNINLLPKGIKNEKREIIDIGSTICFFLIFTSIAILIYCYFENEKLSQNVRLLNSQSNLIEIKLVEEISNNKKFVISEVEGGNIEYILSTHSSFSKIIDHFEKMLTDDVYIESYSIIYDEDMINIEFVGSVKDYQSAATQLYIIKQMSETKMINLKEFNQKGMDLDFSGMISFDKNIGK